jgi:hypothetical protein
MWRPRVIFMTLLMWPMGAHGVTTVLGPAAIIQRDPIVFQCVADGDVYPIEGTYLGLYLQAVGAAQISHIRKDAFRVCNDRQNNHHYFLRDVRLTENHICRFIEQEVFPVYGPGNPAGSPNSPPRLVVTSWSLSPPEDWRDKGYKSPARSYAYAGNGACPRADSPKYFEVKNVSTPRPLAGQ